MGTLTASDTFLLTVTAVNTRRRSSNIANQTTNEDTATGAIGVHGGRRGDGGGEPDGDRHVVEHRRWCPTANIVFGGSGASRTVTVTPAANQSGTRDDHGDGERRAR